MSGLLVYLAFQTRTVDNSLIATRERIRRQSAICEIALQTQVVNSKGAMPGIPLETCPAGSRTDSAATGTPLETCPASTKRSLSATWHMAKHKSATCDLVLHTHDAKNEATMCFLLETCPAGAPVAHVFGQRCAASVTTVLSFIMPNRRNDRWRTKHRACLRTYLVLQWS